MKIAIARQGENIVAVKDYTNIKEKGEISHFLMEIELIKLDLMELWDEYNSDGIAIETEN